MLQRCSKIMLTAYRSRELLFIFSNKKKSLKTVLGFSVALLITTEFFAFVIGDCFGCAFFHNNVHYSNKHLIEHNFFCFITKRRKCIIYSETFHKSSIISTCKEEHNHLQKAVGVCLE